MMLLALGANIGGRGDIGFTSALGEPAGKPKSPASRERLRREVRAAAPTPNPACLKKYRRVTDRSISCASFKGKFFIGSHCSLRYFLPFPPLFFPFPPETF